MKKWSLAEAASDVAATEKISGQQLLGRAFRRGLCSRGTRRARTVDAIPLLVLLALLWGCSGDTSKPAESAKAEAKGADSLTGRSAFQKMFIAARGWARDAQRYRLESTPTSDANGRDGKSAMWRAFFASPSQRGAKPFIWSGSTAENAPSRGVNPGNEDNYSPSNSSTQIFDSAFLKVDSDQAFATAQKHGGDKTLQNSPATPLFYSCDWTPHTNHTASPLIYAT